MLSVALLSAALVFPPLQGTVQAEGTDDDWIPDPAGVLQLEAGSYTAYEGEGYMTFTVLRTDGAGGTVSVDVGVGSGSAMAGEDFENVIQTITFNEGETSKSFGVTIYDDSEAEELETFGVSLFNPTGGASIGLLSSAGVSIVDNDVYIPPSYGVFDLESADYYVQEGQGYVDLKVVRTAGQDGVVSVDYSTSEISASEGSDYERTAGTLVFEEGAAEGTITIPVYNDADVEGEESFSLTLSNPAGGAELGTVAGTNITIGDDDEWIPDPAGMLSLETGAVTVYEGESYVSFPVYRKEGAGGTVTVDYSIGGGSASEGQDYEGTSGTLVFEEGVMVQVIEVKLLDDQEDESDESFAVSLGNPTGGAELGAITSTAVTVIDNDDAAPTGSIQFAHAFDKVDERKGTVTLKVVRKGGSSGRLTVSYATVDGTAAAGSDYISAQGELVFEDGETVKDITLQVLNDGKKEQQESFTVRLFQPSLQGAVGEADTLQVMIKDKN